MVTFDVLALRSGFRGPSSFGEKHASEIRGVPQNAGALHRLRPLGAGWQRACFFQSGQRLGIEIELRSRIPDVSSHGVNATCAGGYLDAGGRLRRAVALVRRRSSRWRRGGRGRWPPPWFRCDRIAGIRMYDARNLRDLRRRRPLSSASGSLDNADDGAAAARDRVSSSWPWRKNKAGPKKLSVRWPTKCRNNGAGSNSRSNSLRMEPGDRVTRERCQRRRRFTVSSPWLHPPTRSAAWSGNWC
jgi:hypothetical protein